MADAQHEEILRQGVKEWNRWRRRNPDVVPDLSRSGTATDPEADMDSLISAVLNQVVPGRAPTAHDGLKGSDLNQVNFRGADLTQAFLDGAMLIEADLRAAKLDDAHLTGCVLTAARLRKATLRGADLTAATLRWADLSGADLSQAVLRQANLNDVRARRAIVRGADLGYASFVGADLRGADLTGAYVYGTSAWDVDLRGTTQEHLVITMPSEPEVSVDDLKVAQFLHLVIANANIRDVIDTVTTKVVLVLGRFTPERKTVLDAVHDALRSRDLIPVLFDFERPHTRDITETVTTLPGSPASSSPISPIRPACPKNWRPSFPRSPCPCSRFCNGTTSRTPCSRTTGSTTGCLRSRVTPMRPTSSGTSTPAWSIPHRRRSRRSRTAVLGSSRGRRREAHLCCR